MHVRLIEEIAAKTFCWASWKMRSITSHTGSAEDDAAAFEESRRSGSGVRDAAPVLPPVKERTCLALPSSL